MFSQTQVIPYFDLLHYLRQKLDSIAITNSRIARFFCWLIPASCPFERTITVFERTLFHIPPLCKLNPLYEQLIGIRFRSLTYLASEGSKI